MKNKNKSSKRIFTIKNFIQGSKDVIKACDLFSRPVTSNYQGEPEYQTLTGGICSIMLIITFIVVFATTLLGTFRKQFIDFRENKIISDNPTAYNLTLDKTFLFAIGISDVNLNIGKRYFNIFMEQRIYNGSQKLRRRIPLKPCQKSDWEEFSYGDLFDSMNLQQYLCPRNASQLIFELQGKHTSEIFKFYKIGVKKCQNSQDPSRPCASQTEIEQFLTQQESFVFNFYFINALINPSDHSYFKRYFEDSNYFFFSPQDGVEANLFVSEYQIDTDNSLSPYEDHEIIQGAVVLDQATISPYRVRKDQYMRLFIRKSPISIDIERSYRKVDDTLSYIGGLFSFLLMFFAFISIYNEFSFEIDVTENNYKNEDPQNQFDANFFNIYTFFWYMVYLALEKIGYEPNWKDYKHMHNYLKTARKQLDITYQLKKSQLNQKLWMCLLEEYQLKALMMSGPLPLKEAQKIYNYLDMHKKLKKSYFPDGKQWVDGKKDNNDNSEQSIRNKLLDNDIEQVLTDDSDEGQSSSKKDGKQKQDKVKSSKIMKKVQSQNEQKKVNQSDNILIQIQGTLIDMNDKIKQQQKKEQFKSQQSQDSCQDSQDEQPIDLQEVKQIMNHINDDKDKLSIKIKQRIDPIIKGRFLQQKQQQSHQSLQSSSSRQILQIDYLPLQLRSSQTIIEHNHNNSNQQHVQELDQNQIKQ